MTATLLCPAAARTSASERPPASAWLTVPSVVNRQRLHSLRTEHPARGQKPPADGVTLKRLAAEVGLDGADERIAPAGSLQKPLRLPVGQVPPCRACAVEEAASPHSEDFALRLFGRRANWRFSVQRITTSALTESEASTCSSSILRVTGQGSSGGPAVARRPGVHRGKPPRPNASAVVATQSTPNRWPIGSSSSTTTWRYALVTAKLLCPAAARTSASERPPASAWLTNVCRP